MKYLLVIFSLLPVFVQAQAAKTSGKFSVTQLKESLSRVPGPRARLDVIDRALSDRLHSNDLTEQDIARILELRKTQCELDHPRCANFEKLFEGLCTSSLSGTARVVWKGLTNQLSTAEEGLGLKKVFDSCSKFEKSLDFAKVDLYLQAIVSNRWPDAAPPMFAKFEKSFGSENEELGRMLSLIQAAAPEIEWMKPVPLALLRNLALFSVRLAEKGSVAKLPVNDLRYWIVFLSHILFATGDLDRFVKAMDLVPFSDLADKNWNWAVAPIRLKCAYQRSIGKTRDCVSSINSYLSNSKGQLGVGDRIELESELAKSGIESGQAAQAAAQLDELSKKAEAAQLSFTSMWLAYHETRAFLALDKTAQAAKSLEVFLNGSQSSRQVGPWISAYGSVLEMRNLIDTQKLDEALAVGERTVRILKSSVQGVPEVLVWLELQTALIYAVRGNTVKLTAVKKTLNSEIDKVGTAKVLETYLAAITARSGGAKKATEILNGLAGKVGAENFDLVWMKRAMSRDYKK